jgi:hypothetical protein
MLAFRMPGMPVDYDLNAMRPGQTLFDVTSRVLTGMEAVLDQSKPDIVTPGVAYSSVPRWHVGEERASGTSMAAPHAAGLAALLVSALRAEGRTPNARLINARRHPLDTCLSCYRQLFARGQPFTYDLTELGEYYLEYEKMMAHWHAALPGRVLDLQYEDMVTDQEAQTRRLLEFCGLPFEDACLRYHETERAIRTASSEQVRQPIYDSSVNFWRHYERELEPLIEILRPVLPAFGRDPGLGLSSTGQGTPREG